MFVDVVGLPICKSVYTVCQEKFIWEKIKWIKDWIREIGYFINVNFNVWILKALNLFGFLLTVLNALPYCARLSSHLMIICVSYVHIPLNSWFFYGLGVVCSIEKIRWIAIVGKYLIEKCYFMENKVFIKWPQIQSKCAFCNSF